ncbi:hypothetical protein H0H81_001391 [Sphagnurus paluster]|uniref:PEBP-like protein n=1 Tax=Sphagnurus paluster TaxID=117069 RepID=A0A9P7K6J5_9AGAR|nr:hypothetical protein H0H81_001391 [Sphagnurus paluster]
MLALRRLRVPGPTTASLLRRGNTSLQGASESSPELTVPPPAPAPTPVQAKPATKPAAAKATSAPAPAETEEPTTQGRRRRKRPVPPQRPDISSAAPRKWNHPLAEGVLPAYDLALKLLRTDSIRLAEEADGVRREVEALEAELSAGGAEVEVAREKEALLEKKREKLKILEVQSQVNLPEVRWKVANAMADMRNPAHRHLVEQRWRKDGDLDLLMERIHQMKVVPDVLPDLRPTIDVHVAARTTKHEQNIANKRHTTVEPGTFLLPEQAHVPDESNASFRTFLHWMKPNVPLSAAHQSRITGLNNHTPYIPPHPQRGTPYHRYVLLLLQQPALGADTYTHNIEARAAPGVPTSVTLDIPPVEAEARRDFDVRAFMRRWGLDGAQGGGAHMWREVWNEKVSSIYRNVLKEPEPRYGRAPKADPYAELKHRKRYV